MDKNPSRTELRSGSWLVEIALCIALAIVVALVIVSLLTSSGCANVRTERQALRTAADAYATAVDLAAHYLEAGLLTPEQAARIEEMRRLARAALDAWRESLEGGAPTQSAVARWNDAIRALEIELIRVKGGGHE